MGKGKRRRRRKGNAKFSDARSSLQISSNTDSQAPPDDREEDLQEPLSEDTYSRERGTLIEIEQKSADQNDKAILTLTAGAIGLSLTFLDKIAPNPTAETFKFIGFAWSALTLSIIAMLTSFLTSQSACRRQRKLLDIAYETGKRPEEANWFSDLTRYLNNCAYVSFLVGVVFLILFAWMNLVRENRMSEQRPSQAAIRTGSTAGQKEERGGVPPTGPAKPNSGTKSPKPTK